MNHINKLQNKLSRETTIKAQAEEFAEILEECNNSQIYLIEKFNKKNVYVTKRLTFYPNG
jgi:hypothetical protein